MAMCKESQMSQRRSDFVVLGKVSISFHRKSSLMLTVASRRRSKNVKQQTLSTYCLSRIMALKTSFVPSKAYINMPEAQMVKNICQWMHFDLLTALFCHVIMKSKTRKSG